MLLLPPLPLPACKLAGFEVEEEEELGAEFSPPPFPPPPPPDGDRGAMEEEVEEGEAYNPAPEVEEEE